MRIPEKIWSGGNCETSEQLTREADYQGWRKSFRESGCDTSTGLSTRRSEVLRNNMHSLPDITDALRYPPAISRNRAYSFRWFYSRHHALRFEWMRDKIAARNFKPVSILELGCHDSRSLGFVPVNVHRYVGLDAGWQSGWNGDTPYGLEAGRIRLKGNENFEVRQSNAPRDIELLEEQFDIALVLETFEYLEPTALEPYIAALAGKVGENTFPVTQSPTEKGNSARVQTPGAPLPGNS